MIANIPVTLSQRTQEFEYFLYPVDWMMQGEQSLRSGSYHLLFFLRPCDFPSTEGRELSPTPLVTSDRWYSK